MSLPTRVALVDDDPGLLRSLRRLLRIHGIEVEVFESAEDFLLDHRNTRLECAIVDVAMPGMDGLALQERLAELNARLPILFLSGNADIPIAVRAIKAGAVNLLTKPVDETTLLDALRLAMIARTEMRAVDRTLGLLRGRFAQLTPRESEVLRHVIAGRPNKRIADDLGISEQTVKIHRMRVSRKTGLPSVAELVRAAGSLGIEPAP